MTVTDTVEGVPVVRLLWRGSTHCLLAPCVLRAICLAALMHVHATNVSLGNSALTRPLHGERIVNSIYDALFMGFAAESLYVGRLASNQRIGTRFALLAARCRHLVLARPAHAYRRAGLEGRVAE